MSKCSLIMAYEKVTVQGVDGVWLYSDWITVDNERIIEFTPWPYHVTKPPIQWPTDKESMEYFHKYKRNEI